MADLNPAGGTVPGKIRPVVVLQTNSLNKVGHPSTIILPITSVVFKESELLRINLLPDAENGLEKENYKKEAYWIVILASCMLPFLSNDVFVYLGHGYLSNHGVDVFSHTNILKDSIWINYIDAWPDGPCPCPGCG